MTVPPHSLILAMDTSGPTARVALVGQEGTRVAGGERTAERHSANLLRLCDEALRAAQVRADELAAIACGAGPGSFTGLRVALAVAKGLAMPSDRPLLLVSSLQALAIDLSQQTKDGAPVVPCIDAGKGEVYAQPHGADHALPQPTGPQWRLTPQAMAERLRAHGDDPLMRVGGTGVDRHVDVLRTLLPAGSLIAPAPGPTAEAIARLAWQRHARGERDPLSEAVPSYGRAPDITRPRPRQP